MHQSIVRPFPPVPAVYEIDGLVTYALPRVNHAKHGTRVDPSMHDKDWQGSEA